MDFPLADFGAARKLLFTILGCHFLQSPSILMDGKSSKISRKSSTLSGALEKTPGRMLSRVSYSERLATGYM